MLSILKVQLPNNSCARSPLRLLSSVTTVRSLGSGIEASRTLIYNGFVQRQPLWYLQIPLPRVMNMMQIELQVRDKFRYAFKIGNYLQRVCQSYLLIFQILENRDLWKWQHRCIVRLAIQAQCHTFSMLTDIPSDEDFRVTI